MNLPEWTALYNTLDRGVSLSPLEQYTLAQWVCQPPAAVGRRKQELERELQHLRRLTRPIEAVFEHCEHPDPDARITYACAVLLLREMHERQTTLWAWDQAMWVETVGVTQDDFAKRHTAFCSERLLTRINLRHYLISCAYLLGNIKIHTLITDCRISSSARGIFGSYCVRTAYYTVAEELMEAGRDYWNIPGLSNSVALALLLQGSSLVEEITPEVMNQVYMFSTPSKGLQKGCVAMALALHRCGILPQAIFAPPPTPPRPVSHPRPKDTLPVGWKDMIQAWGEVTWTGERTVASQRSRIAKAGRWAAAVFPTAALPAQWTAGIAKAFVESVCTMKVGDWNRPQGKRKSTGKRAEMRAAVRVQIICAVRCFFIECQAAGLLPPAFDPTIFLKTPSDLLRACGPNPMVIQWDIWKQLEQAGLTLTQADLPGPLDVPKAFQNETAYPLSLVRALAAVWLFGGLRRDEIGRLSVACIRWLPASKGHTQEESARRVVNLQVPANKSGGPFEKAVDVRLGKALEAWQKHRRTIKEPTQGKAEHRNLLFCWQGRALCANYINQVLIPILCRKAGISNHDEWGRITCHRGRATLATQLYQTGVPFSHVQQWLGHRSARSTAYYISYDTSVIPESVRHAFQAMHETHLPLTTSPTHLDSVSVQIPPMEESRGGLGLLAHLHFQPRETDQALALTARNGLSQVQQNMLLSAAERHVLTHAMELLNTIAIRA